MTLVLIRGGVLPMPPAWNKWADRSSADPIPLLHACTLLIRNRRWYGQLKPRSNDSTPLWTSCFNCVGNPFRFSFQCHWKITSSTLSSPPQFRPISSPQFSQLVIAPSFPSSFIFLLPFFNICGGGGVAPVRQWLRHCYQGTQTNSQYRSLRGSICHDV